MVDGVVVKRRLADTPEDGVTTGGASSSSCAGPEVPRGGVRQRLVQSDVSEACGSDGDLVSSLNKDWDHRAAEFPEGAGVCAWSFFTRSEWHARYGSSWRAQCLSCPQERVCVYLSKCLLQLCGTIFLLKRRPGSRDQLLDAQVTWKDFTEPLRFFAVSKDNKWNDIKKHMHFFSQLFDVSHARVSRQVQLHAQLRGWLATQNKSWATQDSDRGACNTRDALMCLREGGGGR